jgi:hypothetical protein
MWLTCSPAPASARDSGSGTSLHPLDRTRSELAWPMYPVSRLLLRCTLSQDPSPLPRRTK